jgi:hypothetical protein
MNSDDAPKMRRANRGDAQGVAEVHVRSWQSAYPVDLCEMV